MRTLSVFVVDATPTVLTLLLKVTVILCVAGVLVLLLQGSSAARRHFVWFVALSSSLAVAFLQLITPTIGVHVAHNSMLYAISSVQEEGGLGELVSDNEAHANHTATDAAAASANERALQSSRDSTVGAHDGDIRLHRAQPASRSEQFAETRGDHIANDVGSSAALATFTLHCIALPIAATGQLTESNCASWRQYITSRLPVRALIALAWLLGLCLVAARFLIAHIRLAKLVRFARVLCTDEWLREMRRLSAEQTAAGVRLLVHPDVTTPFTSGWLGPVIMLPEAAHSYSAARRRAVLAHELAHIARCDYLALCVATCASALFWFHPAVWIAARCMRTESERAADDCVMNGGMTAVEYATHLLAIAQCALAHDARQTNMISVALGMADFSQLELRLRAMLDGKRSRRAVSRNLARATGVVSMMALVPVAAFRTVVDRASAVTPPRVRDMLPAVKAVTAHAVPARSTLSEGTRTVDRVRRSDERESLPPHRFPVISTTRDEVVHSFQGVATSAMVTRTVVDSLFEKTIATSDSVTALIDMDMIATFTPHWWDESAVKVRVVPGTLPLQVTFELHGDSAVLHSFSSDGRQAMSAQSHIEVWVPRRARIVERTTTPRGWRIRVHGMSSLRVAPRDSAMKEPVHVFQSQSVRARVDTSFEQTVSAVSGERLTLNLPAGGDVVVHGW